MDQNGPKMDQNWPNLDENIRKHFCIQQHTAFNYSWPLTVPCKENCHIVVCTVKWGDSGHGGDSGHIPHEKEDKMRYPTISYVSKLLFSTSVKDRIILLCKAHTKGLAILSYFSEHMITGL